MAHQFNILYLPIILVLFSCVENKIFIQLYPDGQTYFKFESLGDSSDIFDKDFLHPHNFHGWKKSLSVIKEEDQKNWILTSEGLSSDTAILFYGEKLIPLGYSFYRNTRKSYFSIEYSFTLIFYGRHIETEYPKLYEAILSEKPDSLYWLSEALTVLMHKGLNDIAGDSLTPRKVIWNQRLVNHLQNSFSRIKSINDFENIQKNRIAFFTDLLKPFKMDHEFASNLVDAMEIHENILESTLDLKDDSFEIKAILPGHTINTNADEIKEDTLIWKFGLDSLLRDTYVMDAKSIIYTTDRFRKTLISVGVLFLLLMVIIIKKYFRS